MSIKIYNINNKNPQLFRVFHFLEFKINVKVSLVIYELWEKRLTVGSYVAHVHKYVSYWPESDKRFFLRQRLLLYISYSICTGYRRWTDETGLRFLFRKKGLNSSIRKVFFFFDILDLDVVEQMGRLLTCKSSQVSFIILRQIRKVSQRSLQSAQHSSCG